MGHRERERLLRGLAGVRQVPAAVQDVDEVRVRTGRVFDALGAQPDRKPFAQVPDSALEVTEVEHAASERGEGVALDLRGADAPGDADRFLAERLRIAEEHLVHHDLGEAGRDPRAGQSRRLGDEPDGFPAGVHGGESAARVPQVAAQTLLEQAQTGRLRRIASRGDGLLQEADGSQRVRFGRRSGGQLEEADPIEPGPVRRVGDPIPQLQCAFVLRIRISERVHPQGGCPGTHRRLESPRELMRRGPVVGELRGVPVVQPALQIGQSVGEPSMEAHSLAGQQLGVDRLLDERVSEHERLLGAELIRNEDVPLDGLAQRETEIRFVSLGHAREEAGRYPRSGGRREPEELLGRLRERSDAGEQDITQHRRQGTPRRLDREQLLDEEGVSARATEDGFEEVGIRWAFPDPADLHGELGAIERHQVDPLRAPAALQLRQVRQ